MVVFFFGTDQSWDCARVSMVTWALFQYPIKRLTVRSRKDSKPRDLYLALSDRSEIWQAPRQQGCRSACQISKRCDNLNYQSRGFETSRDLTIRRLIGYWNGALEDMSTFILYITTTKHREVRIVYGVLGALCQPSIQDSKCPGYSDTRVPLRDMTRSCHSTYQRSVA